MNTNEFSKIIAICGCGGYLIVTISGAIACTNPRCPQHMCEEKIHLPEKGDTGVSGYHESFVTTSGTALSGVTTTTYPYIFDRNNNDGGGER